ncbi:hypothetical protein AVEN_127464-1 [Araneus ventricosus]|uniref:Uncharacterized protein n=1 Tax=Araneus ventricosus TaxID=182803 RepID=A0A4Y2FW20_ARAVE|nr:hypothetical protein AVEN_127464-1 [Araneus ventricosus]
MSWLSLCVLRFDTKAEPAFAMSQLMRRTISRHMLLLSQPYNIGFVTEEVIAIMWQIANAKYKALGLITFGWNSARGFRLFHCNQLMVRNQTWLSGLLLRFSVESPPEDRIRVLFCFMACYHRCCDLTKLNLL